MKVDRVTVWYVNDSGYCYVHEDTAPVVAVIIDVGISRVVREVLTYTRYIHIKLRRSPLPAAQLRLG